MGEIKLVGVEKLKQIKNENEAKGVSARKIFVYKERKFKKKTKEKKEDHLVEKWLCFK